MCCTSWTTFNIKQITCSYIHPVACMAIYSDMEFMILNRFTNICDPVENQVDVHKTHLFMLGCLFYLLCKLTSSVKYIASQLLAVSCFIDKLF